MTQNPYVLVILESPYAADSFCGVHRHTEYAREALMDCLSRGEAPIASHLLYTQVLDDRIPEYRAHGIEAGLAWGRVADKTVVYTDLGVSPGMRIGITRALVEGRPVELRSLESWRDDAKKAGFSSGSDIRRLLEVPDVA